MDPELPIEDAPVEDLSISGDPTPYLPSVPVATVRAKKIDYGLGDKSPGEESLKSTLLSGNEQGLRQNVAFDEDMALQRTRLDIVSQLARQNGKNLRPDQMDLVMGMTKAELRTDPATILEKKFSEKYINDVLSLPGASWEQGFVAPAMQEAEIASTHQTWKEFLQKGKEDLDAKHDAQGWGSYLSDIGGNMVPFLPWWRLKHSMENRPGVEFMPGTTMAENYAYLHTLPPQQRQVEYKKAVDYLEGKNLSLAQEFANGALSFSTSDEVLGDLMGLADYSTGASVIGKGVLKVFGKGAAKAAKAGESVVDTVKALENSGTPGVAKAADVPRPPEVRQLDLFGEQPEQGAFRFADKESLSPSANKARLNQDVQDKYGISAGSQPLDPYEVGPNGLFRGQNGKVGKAATRQSEHGDYAIPQTSDYPDVSKTGIFRGKQGKFGFDTQSMKQGELPLDRPAQQGSFDFSGPSSRGMSKEAEYEALVAEKNAATKAAQAAEPPQVQQLKHQLADAIKATEDTHLNAEQLLAGNGDTGRSGMLGALRILKNKVAGIELDDLANVVPTFANPKGFLMGSKVINRERAHAMAGELQKQGEGLLEAFLAPPRVSRMTPEALARGQQIAADGLRAEYGKRIGDGILDVRFTPKEMNRWANADEAYLVIGRGDKNLFTSEANARMQARDVYGLGDKEYRVTQQGGNYQIEVPRFVREDDDLVRDGLHTPNNSTNSSIANMLLNRVRSSEDLVSPFQRDQRHIATHAPQELRKALVDVIHENITALPKASRNAVEDLLRLNRDMDSVKYPGERGRWYDTAQEMEQAFLLRNKRLPNEAEIKAYETFKQVSDLDYLFRNSAVYRDKARLGIEGWTLKVGDQQVPWFEGKSLPGMPWKMGKSDHDAGLYFYDASTGVGRFKYKFNMTDAERKEADALIENGHRVVQVFDPKKHPLEGIAQGVEGPIKDQINFVITNAFEKRQLQWQQVDYRPGGHVIYPENWYVKQPVIKQGRGGKDTYFGDNSVLNVQTEAEAKKWAERIDQGRVLLKAGRTDEVKRFVEANLPHTYEEFTRMFFGEKAPLSLDHPVVYSESGKNTIDTVPWLKGRYKDMVDGTKNPYDLSNFMDKSFLADRDNILNTVTEGKGMMQLSPARQLDPYVALNKAMGQSLRNVWMNDYKIQAVDSWLKEFSDVMKPGESVLGAHPTYFLYNPQWKENVSDQARLAAAKASQRAIVNFIGTQSELGGAMKHIGNKLMSTIYDTTGQKGLATLEKINDATETLGLSGIKDPVSFMRAVAFHSKLGLFNPVQLFVQMQSMANSIAVAGISNGTRGVAAAVLSRILAHNPEQLETMAKVAGAMGWKQADFKEMYGLMRQSGVYQVAGEAALRDDIFDPKLFQGTVGTFLDKGGFFFNEGERLNRLTAFATAYREFKAANAGVKIGDREFGQIMTRSDLLSVNMTRASSAAWQAGPLSVPTQFFAYNARLAEQFLGGRLTGAEKLRSLATYSAMYGVPIGVGSAVGVWPVYDDVHEYAIKNNIDLHTNYMSGLSDGLLSLATHYALGKEYNVASRLGPGNNSTIKDALDGDKSFGDIVFGASGSIMGDIWKATYPFQYKVAGIFSNTGEYPTKSSDWMSLFRNISTVDIGAKVHGILSYGKWATKNGTVMGEADTMDAAMAVLGLTPTHISETSIKRKAVKGIEASQNPYEKDALRNYMMGLQEFAAGNQKSGDEYFLRGRTAIEAGDFNHEAESKLFRRAMDQGRSMEDKIDWDLVRKQTGSQKNNQFDTYFKGKK